MIRRRVASVETPLATPSKRSKLCLYPAVACFLLFSLPLFARSWRVTDYNDAISVAEDGSAIVHERITLSFEGEWHGIHRFIPVEYPGPRGTNYTLFLNVTSVTDGDGGKLKYESSTSNDFRDLKIYIPGAADATRTVEIDYTVRNGTRFFEDHDEFYWNVTGNDWPVPIDHATAVVSFPNSAAGSLRAQAFTGVYGSAERGATTAVEGSDVLVETNNPLPMRGGLTVDVYIPKGILKEPSTFTRWLWFLGSNPIVFLPFWTLAVMFTLWWYKGRDPDPGISVAPMYEPPPDMSPAEAGTLLEDAVHPRDITCTLVDLAVRGFVKIEEVDDKGLVFHHKDYVFHLLIPQREWHGLASHEKVMLDNVFGNSDEIRLSALKNRFYTAIPVIKQDIMAQLRQKGMYLVDPDSANGYSFVAILFIVAPFLMLQYLWNMSVFSSFGLLIGAGLLSALIWWLFARQMTAKTVKGGRTRIAVLGFQEFMNRVDADRLKRMPPDTFEKFLPYAMALGVEHQWAQAFAGIVTNPPSWYAGPGYGPGFNAIYFASAMHGMSNDMHQVFVSAPRASSTGSGFGGGGFGGGGGFSGGGFGGGGGGAF
ncbi:MAG TPA: DUF2207 domain-containing protein [Terriglobales bacterium]|jgi:uncharacterized membrane protein YgcG|nr:DUF2207 domain-containing protein [Terriglobales bacterium]